LPEFYRKLRIGRGNNSIKKKITTQTKTINLGEGKIRCIYILRLTNLTILKIWHHLLMNVFKTTRVVKRVIDSTMGHKVSTMTTS